MQFKRILLSISLLAAATAAASAQVVTAPFSPANRLITPFGYGTVNQQLVTTVGGTGAAWCLLWYGISQKCLSVSGGNSCAALVPPGELVSCNAVNTPPVDESAFATIDCKNQPMGPIGPLGSLDWCLTAALETTRTTDTLYLYSDYVRVGTNRRFGGTIFELYGTDKTNRIMQNGGGAMQLSLWGNDTTYAPPGSKIGYFQIPTSSRSCNPKAYSSQSSCVTATGGSCEAGLVGSNDTDCSVQFACDSNNAAAGSAINPIQAISAGCNYGKTQFSNNEAAVTGVTSPKPGQISFAKSGPQQFTKSTHQQVTHLTWSQTMKIIGPFAETTYQVRYNGTNSYNADFQEIPAILTGQGMTGGYVYYYSGSKPYADATSQVTRGHTLDTDTQVYQFPNRPGPFGAGVPPGYGAFLTEDWVSLCDATQTKCITVVSFSPDAQDLIYGPGDYSYFGIHGFFAIGSGLKKTIPVWVAPYRFDDVVGGMTVRQWIYSLHQNPKQ